MKNQQQNQNEKKVNYSQNLGVVEEEAKIAFLELVDEVKSANTDNREVNLLSSKKAKIFEYYLIFLKEIEKIKSYCFFSFIAFVVWMNYDKKLFQMTSNFVLDTAIESVFLFLFFSFIVVAMQSANNIERFFLKLYPQLKTEKEVSLISLTLRDFLFSDYQKKENGFRKIFFLTFVLILLESLILYSGKILNLNILGLSVFFVFLLLQKKENNVLKNV